MQKREKNKEHNHLLLSLLITRISARTCAEKFVTIGGSKNAGSGQRPHNVAANIRAFCKKTFRLTFVFRYIFV